MNERRMSLGNRVISLVLALVMVIGMMPSGVFAFHAKAADSATAGNVDRIRQYAANLLNSDFSKAASEDPDSKDDKFTWDTEGKTTNWRYYNGVMLDAFLMLGVDSNAGNALEFAKDFLDTNTENSDSKAVTHYTTKEVDSVPPALVLFDLLDTAEVSEADRAIYVKAINYVYGQLENQTKYSNCGGNFLHKMDNTSWSTWNIGLDGIYMAQPFLMEYAHALEAGKITNTVNSKTASDIYKEVYDRLMWVADNMYDSNTGLYHHGWNVEDSKGNGHFWSRGIGWYAAGLVMCIDLMPEDTTYKTNLIGKLPKLFDGMLNYQDVNDRFKTNAEAKDKPYNTGMWYNVVNKDCTLTDNKGNILETSGTALMAFAMMKAYNEGWVTEAKYATAAEKAFNGIVAQKLNSSNTQITGVYLKSGVCESDANYCSEEYKTNEAKGVGPVIMAASEMAKYIGGIETFTTGVVVAPSDMTIVAGGTVDTSNVKVSLLGGQGSIANGVAGQMAYEIGAANSNGKATVTVKNGDATIGTFQVNVVDPSTPATGNISTSTTTGGSADSTAPVRDNNSSYVEIVAPSSSTTGGSSTNHTGSNDLDGWVQTVVGSNGSGNGSTVEYVLYSSAANSSVPSGKYIIVYSTNGTSGKALTNVEGALDGGSVPATPTDVEIKNSKITSDINSYTVWTLGDDGKAYNGTNYIQGGDNTKLLNASGKATALSFVKDGTTGGWLIMLSSKYAMKWTGSNFGRPKEENPSGLNIFLFKETTVESTGGTATESEYAKLSGTATYTITPSTYEDVDALLAQLQSDYTIYTNSSASDTDRKKVEWTDSNVEYSWSPSVNLSEAGTYVLTVKYKEKTLGTITVAVNTTTEGTTTTTPGEYAKLDGTKGYAFPYNTKSDDVIAAIQNDTASDALKVLISANADGSNATALTDGLKNGRIKIAKNASGPEYKMDAANTYYFGVTLDGKKIGEIPVKIYDPNATTGGTTTTTWYNGNLTLNPTSVSMTVGDADKNIADTLTATAVEGGANATINNFTTTWTTSNSSVATVDSNGNVHAVGAGTATITAKLATVTVNGATGTIHEDITATATVTVTASGNTPSTGSTYIHNFTTDDKNSSFYSISGSLSTSKGSMTYDGKSLTQCLKMESSTNISFEADSAGSLTLVFGGSTDAAGKDVTIDGTVYTTDSNGILTIDLAAGSHTITKGSDGDAINLFYMVFVENSNVVAYSLSDLVFNPTSVNAGQGVSVSTTFSATDNQEHTYTIQWKIDGNNWGDPGQTPSTGFTPMDAGEYTVTATLTHVDGTELATPVTKTGTITVSAATVNGGTLNNTSVTVTQGNNINLAALSATLTYSNDTTSNVNLAQSGFTFKENGSNININDVDATVGSHSVEVFYNGVSIGTMTVMVNAKTEITDTITYELDTDGIDAGEEYIVVAIYNGKYYAMGHNSGSTTEKGYAATIDGNTVTIDESNLTTGLWKFEAVDGKTGYYYISNGGYYVKPGGSTVFNTSKTATQVITHDLVTGQYRINVGDESKERDLYLSSNSNWERADQGNVSTVYLYKKVEAQTTLTLGNLPVLQIGGSTYQATLANYVTSVKVNGTTYEKGNYVIKWTSNDTTVATVSDGLVSAVGGGRTQLVAKLISVGGTDVSAQDITAVADVIVEAPTVELGEDVHWFIAESADANTFTIESKVLVGSTAVTSKELKWTSSNPSVATVNETTGEVTIVGAGTAEITAQIVSVNGRNIDQLMTITDSMIINAEEVVIASGKLGSETVTVAKDAEAAAVESALSGITLTLTKNNGDTVKVDHATLFDGVDLSGINTAAPGSYYINLHYEDPNSDYVFDGMVEVKVIDESLLDEEGIITVETNVTYVIDTDGIDEGEEYVIVKQSDGKWVALMNPDATGTGGVKGSSQIVTRSDDGETITISENASLVRWKFLGDGTSKKGNYTYTTFTTISNNARYLYLNGDNILRSESGTVYTYRDGDKYYIAHNNFSSSKSYPLVLDGSSWTRGDSRTDPSSTSNYVYLYKKVGTDNDYSVGFSVDPTEKLMATGTSFTVTDILVNVNGTVEKNYKIQWTSDNEEVATVDQNGKITAKKAGPATITATLVEASGSQVINNSSNAVGIPKTIEVEVKDANLTYILQGSPLTVALGGEPDFSKVSLLIDSDIGADMVVPGDQLVFKYIDAVANGFDTSVPNATCEVDVYYNGKLIDKKLVLKVADNAYDGLEEATSYPEYPNTGAVRMDKTATGINFNTTGVAKIELNAAGVSSRNPVDVVLIVDVSNSMNWSMDWFVTNPDATTDAAKTDSSKDDKLDLAMIAAQDFARILMENNVAGSDTNNSMTFVTFGGNDKDRGGTSDVDTVVTAFVGEETLANVNNSFANTMFTASRTLTIAGTDGKAIVSGGARGNTMYDSAFLEAIDAVNALKIAKAGSVEAYEKSGREVHVIFMTDGAPSHYNGLCHDNGNTCGGKYTRINCDGSEWLAHIQEPNTTATQLYGMVSDFHIVGYDLAHGGYGSDPAYSWSEAELGRVLGGLVENKALDYTLATDTDKLNTFFNELGHSLAYAGTHALVTDIVSEEFVLQTDPIDVDGDGNITLTGDNVVDIAPSIQILERRLVVRTDIGSTLKINGVDTLINEEHLGMYVDGGEDVLATVTFDTSDPADKKAFSSALDYGVDIWNDETNIITGAYFTYAFGTKTFEWNIGNIEDTEIALTYYGYLTGAKNEAGEGGRAEGIYATNEMATLKYINTDNQVVTREYPVPHVAWGSAVVNVRFFLVNKNGEFVNRANVTFDNPANRIFLVNSATYKFDLNANPDSMVPGHINAEAAFIAAGINSQYVLYDDVNMDVTNSTMDNKFGSASIVSGIDKSNTGSLVEFVDVYGDRSYIQTTINIPVILADLGESSQKMSDSSVVIDFSNSVQWDSLGANERLYDGYTVDEQESTIELVGFTTYNPAADLKDYIDFELASPNWKESYSTAYGTFTLVADNADAKIDDYIQYTPNAPLNGADHVFAVFKFSSHPVGKPDGYMDYYYMYKQVNVVPATVVHYETTGTMGEAFQSNINGAAWSAPSIAESVAGATQSNKNKNYGADTSYNSCINFAGGSSLFVENTDPFGSRPTVKFTFTGTGIDIISKTDPNQGRVKMTLTGKNTGTTKSVMVLNKGVDNLYQIPVLSVEGLPYDTYEVEIVVYSKTSAYGGQFYLDAINVYGSAQETEVVGSTAAGNTTVGSLYEAAGESKPQILEIRDILLGNNNFGDITASGVQGAVYIDGNTTLGDTSTNFNNYDKIGPNNEVYLSNNQAVAFKLRVEDLAKLPTTLDIGLKSVNGSAAKAVIYVYKTGASDTTPAEYTVTSATAMFYDILGGEDIKTFLGENNEFYVVIANKGTGTLSVTDLKVGYGAAKGSVETVVDITVGSLTQETLKASAQVVSAAIANMNAETNTAIAYAMYTTTIVVVTGQDAQSIVVEDLEGNEIAVNASYVNSDNGARRWRVLVRFNEVGTDTYNIYGIGTNGSRHDTYQQITVDVQLFAPANTN